MPTEHCNVKGEKVITYRIQIMITKQMVLWCTEWSPTIWYIFTIKLVIHNDGEEYHQWDAVISFSFVYFISKELSMRLYKVVTTHKGDGYT